MGRNFLLDTQAISNGEVENKYKANGTLNIFSSILRPPCYDNAIEFSYMDKNRNERGPYTHPFSHKEFPFLPIP
jgi:hypothetical protein